LVEMMLGDISLAEAGAPTGEREPGERLVIEELNAERLQPGFAMEAQGGRICALAGQIGSGASEVLRSLAGLRPEAHGLVTLGGDPLPLGSPLRAARAGVAYISNDRKG